MPGIHQLGASQSSNVAKELKDVFLRTTTTVRETATNLAHLGDRVLEILNDNLGALKRGNTSAIAIKPEVWGFGFEDKCNRSQKRAPKPNIPMLMRGTLPCLVLHTS